MIRLAKPWIGENEQRAVAAVLESGHLVQGPQVERFEQAVAALVGRKHAVAVSSGTSALQLSLRALGVGTVRCTEIKNRDIKMTCTRSRT